MTKMTEPSSNINLSNDDDKNLEFLLDSFGSVISAEDMASAYCEAGHDLTKTSEILYNMLGSSSNNNIIPVDLTSQPASSVSSAATVSTVSGVSGDNNARSRVLTNEPVKIPSRTKPRNSGVSVGTISSVIGADYGRLRASTTEARETTKPVKLMSNEIPVSQIWVEKPKSVEVSTETMDKDVELFLLKMLGDGFQLDTKVIKEVVGGCGYDIRESMEKLLSMSAPTLDLGDFTSALVDQTKSTEEDLSFKFNEKIKINDAAQRSNLEKEVLTTIFTAPERCLVGPRTVLPRRLPRVRKYGLVTAPLEDSVTELRTPIVKTEDNGNENEGIEDNYEVLREAAKEYFVTTYKYYKAAFDAFEKGNLEVAYKLVEQGHFYKAKGREANELSAKMLTQTRDEGEVISVDLNDYDPKEAIRFLKVQMKSMCGIPSIHKLKAIVGTNGDKTKPNARKRLIIKLLERDEIPWTEEQDGQIMVIRMDVINPKRLSFNKS